MLARQQSNDSHARTLQRVAYNALVTLIWTALGRNFDGEKCPLVTIHMPTCDLSRPKRHFCKTTHTVAYLGKGHGAMAPLWPDHENFLRRLYEKVRFLPFSSKKCKIQQCLMVYFHTDTICG